MVQDCSTLSEYITRFQTDGILWKAKQLLTDLDNPILLNERLSDIARTIAMLPANQAAVRDHYVLQISREFKDKISKKTLEKYIADHTIIERKKVDITRSVRKNSVAKLNGEAKTFPFFVELVTESKRDGAVFKGIKVDKLKFVQLLASFGFTRYSTDGDSKDGFTFVRLQDNVISEVSKEEIIDFIEVFIEKQYDFEGAGCKYADPEILLNTFYDGITRYFSKDLFARVRAQSQIIINRDTAKDCNLYFQNGFVKVTEAGYELIGYDKMDGSVWKSQMLDRPFAKLPMQFAVKPDVPETAPESEKIDWMNSFSTDRPLGIFADFVWRICGEKQQRFLSLCSIVGYLVHDFYEYPLKAILFTDSSISDKSEGRTGKTLLGKMVGLVRSMKEINGKDFEASNKNKYEDVERATQVVHLNDVRNKGRFKFDFEDVFNDVTEGFMVNAKFKTPFRHKAKFIISTNRTLPIEGDSQRGRIVEFEMSTFFSLNRSPEKYYEQWLGRDWDEKEFNRFDNFICFCAQMFLLHGIVAPDTINLEARKLLDGTSRQFLDFMHDITAAIQDRGVPWDGYVQEGLGFDRVTDVHEFKFDKAKLYDRFLVEYPDYKAFHFTRISFNKWLHKYAELKLGVKDPEESRSNGQSYIRFKSSTPPQSLPKT